MFKRITVTFTPDEAQALVCLAQAETRPVKDQVRFLVRTEAERRGLWPTPGQTRPAEVRA